MSQKQRFTQRTAGKQNEILYIPDKDGCQALTRGKITLKSTSSVRVFDPEGNTHHQLALADQYYTSLQHQTLRILQTAFIMTEHHMVLRRIFVVLFGFFLENGYV